MMPLESSPKHKYYIIYKYLPNCYTSTDTKRSLLSEPYRACHFLTQKGRRRLARHSKAKSNSIESGLATSYFERIYAIFLTPFSKIQRKGVLGPPRIKVGISPTSQAIFDRVFHLSLLARQVRKVSQPTARLEKSWIPHQSLRFSWKLVTLPTCPRQRRKEVMPENGIGIMEYFIN